METLVKIKNPKGSGQDIVIPARGGDLELKQGKSAYWPLHVANWARHNKNFPFLQVDHDDIKLIRPEEKDPGRMFYVKNITDDEVIDITRSGEVVATLKPGEATAQVEGFAQACYKHFNEVHPTGGKQRLTLLPYDVDHRMKFDGIQSVPDDLLVSWMKERGQEVPDGISQDRLYRLVKQFAKPPKKASSTWSLSDLKEEAKKLGIAYKGKKKADLLRAIQDAHNE